MFSLTNIKPESTDIGEILAKVQDDLHHLKEQIISQAVSREVIDLGMLESAIERTEQSVKDKAEQIIHSSNNQVLMLPSLDGPGSTRKKQQDTSGFKSMLEPLAVANKVHREGPIAPAPGQQAKNLRSLKIISDPSHPGARTILNDRYGVALPQITHKQDQLAKVPGKVIMGSTVDPLSTLPRGNKVDPSRTPPPIAHEDAEKGILSLIERGLIPSAAELTLQPPPIKHHQAPLHKAEQQFSRSTAPPPNVVVGVGGYNLSVVKLDPSGIQAVHQTSLPEDKSAITSSDQQQTIPNKGWTQNSRMKHFQLKAIEGPNRIPVPASTPANELKSVHMFVVQNGKTRVTSQDYLDFKQHYCLSWGSILTLILNLEELLANYCVPIAFIDGDRLADLALVFELGQKPTVQHFLTCIVNAEDVEKILKMPGRRYQGPKGTGMAAIKIQSVWRRYKDRSAYLQYRKQKWAAGVIAISWIMSCKISMVRKQLRETRKLQLRRFKMRATELRDNWLRIKNSRRIIIHLPSLGYPQHIRDGLSEMSIFQNLQMARLCDIMDPKVEVIYVSPVELNDEVYQYYLKLLGMKAQTLNKGDCDIKVSTTEEDKEDIENRYRIVVPDAVDRFPTHNMCLSSILKYSPQTIKRLKNLIKGRDAYIVPGVLHKDDIYVADLLDIPILSPEPDVANLYSSKSGAKRIFLSAKVEVPPGQFDIYSLPQLQESLAKLVTENLHIKRWLFKMDSEFDGRGTAYCDVTANLSCYSWAVKECERYGEKWSKTWAHEPTLIKVSAEVPKIMAQHATPVNRELYPTWDKFLQDFLKRGGIIEACPPCDSVTALCVDVLIEPTGESTILSMADQIHATSRFRCWGYSVPQTSVHPAVICAATEAIASACKVRGIVGYLSTDFVTFIDPKSLDQVVWAIDLKLRYSDSMAMTKLMLYISAGQFDPSLSAFIIPLKTKHEEKPQRRKVVEEDKLPPNQNRYAIISTRLLHSNLSVIHYSVFFQMCRAHGIGFDMKEKAGTIFTLVDSSKREHIGMFVMSDDLQGSLSTFARNLSVIHQEISAPNMQGESNFQPVIDDIDSILGTTEENKQKSVTLTAKSPQLYAPRPKEMQRILKEHLQQMHTIERDRKEMEEEKVKQRLVEEHRRAGQLHEGVQTGQSSAPPPTPAAALSPVGSAVLLARSTSVSRHYSHVTGLFLGGDQMPEKKDHHTEQPASCSADIIPENKGRPESTSEVHAQMFVSPCVPSVEDENSGRIASLRAVCQVNNTSSRPPSPRKDT